MEQQVTLNSFPLISLNIGTVKKSLYKGKEARSGIRKHAVDQTIMLTKTGFQGDEQADLVNHGGEDKAICVYSYDHYQHWERVLEHDLPYGSFGENFTIKHLNESDIFIGDKFQAGTAILQVSQPRQPCWKLAMRWGLDELPMLVTESGATGFYFRVLEIGEVMAGENIMRLETHPARISIAEANRVMHKDKNDIAGIQQLLTLDELSSSWIHTLTSRLTRLQTED
jgi:MOSC domain-containing protein YiiM